ncbi:MAG: hypothetical protein R3A51_16685 [Nannocystaceae bacterium]
MLAAGHIARPRTGLVVAALALVVGLACRSEGRVAATGACDAGKVEELVTRLDAADPHDRPDLIVEGWSRACEVPKALEFMFTLAGEREGVDERAVLRGPDAAALEQRRVLLARVCPDAEEVLTRAASLRARERAATLFDGCALGRFGIMPREEYARHTIASPLPWIGYQWLLDQGVAAASARSMVHALLLLERREFGAVALPRYLSLAPGDVTLPPPANANAVFVTPEHILYDLRGRREQRVTIEPSMVRGELIRPLYDALDEAASFAAALDPEDPDARRLTVYADQRAPFGVVASVLHTAARAGLQPWSLAVERAPFDVGVIEASPWTEGGARRLVDIDARGAVTRSGDPGAPVVEIQAAGEARFGRWVEVAISERAACEATRGCPRLAIALAPR